MKASFPHLLAVSAAYKAKEPACVYIGLDGLGSAAPVVFDPRAPVLGESSL